jgi:uncharacterized membrane protein
MRIASRGHLVFSIMMIFLGIVGLLYSGFVPVWNPVPASIPARGVFVWLGPLISIASGIGLLVPHVAAVATRLLLTTLLLWLLLFRLPNFLHTSPFEACWSVFPLAVILAATWVLYVWFAADWDRQHLSFFSGNKGLRIAHVLYGLSLIFFGSAHFIDLKDTLALIPDWLPGHVFLAYFTGGTFIAAGVSVLAGRCARLAAILSAFQIGLFLFLVWVPIVAAGSRVPFQWSETILNAALFAAAWLVSDSFTISGITKIPK